MRRAVEGMVRESVDEGLEARLRLYRNTRIVPTLALLTAPRAVPDAYCNPQNHSSGSAIGRGRMGVTCSLALTSPHQRQQ